MSTTSIVEFLQMVDNRFSNMESMISKLLESKNSIPSLIIDEKKPLRLKAAADYLGIASSTLYGLVSKGKLIPLKPGKHLLFTREMLDKYYRGESMNPDPSSYVLHRKKAKK